MRFMTEAAIAEVVLRRIDTKWFGGLIAGMFIALFFITTQQGHDATELLINNRKEALSFISIVSTLLVVMVGATEIPHDLSSTLLLVILSKPIERHQYLTGKFAGMLAIGTTFSIISIFFVACSIWFQGEPPDMELLRQGLVCVMRISIISALTLFFSTAFSELQTIIFSCAIILLSHVMFLLSASLMEIELPVPAMILLSLGIYAFPNIVDFSYPDTWLSQKIFDYSLEKTSANIDFDSLLAGQNIIIGRSVLYSITYCCLIMATAILFFRRREFR